MVSSSGGKKASSFELYGIQKKVADQCSEHLVFSADNALLFLVSGHICHKYSTTTGEHLGKVVECSSLIIACQLHPFNSSLLVVATDKGEVVTVDINSSEKDNKSVHLKLKSNKLRGKQVNTFSINKEFPTWNDYKKIDWGKTDLSEKNVKFYSFVLCAAGHAANNTHGTVFASWSLADEYQAHITEFSIETGYLTHAYKFRDVMLRKCKKNFAINKTLFVGMSTYAVYVSLAEKGKFLHTRMHIIGRDSRVTCLALHPLLPSFATGDSLGRILIWANVNQKSPLKTTFHWHSLPVASIAYSVSGSYLFSGGEEAVLVAWSLNSQNKNFLPRLSGEITCVTMGGESKLLAVSTQDGKILLLDNNCHSVATIQHISRWSCLAQASSPSIFTLDPKTGALVLSGKTGYLQFLSSRHDGKFLYTLDVVSSNIICREREFAIANLEVTHAELSQSGQWLITAEARVDKLSKESRLKFWAWDDENQTFSLNTSIELPHGDHAISRMAVSHEDLVGTTGPDGSFKLWSLVETHYMDRIVFHWSLVHTRTYGNLTARTIDFSMDGTLVAVGFGPLLSVWDTDSCVVKCSLTPPLERNQLKVAKFGQLELSHLILAGTESTITSWNLITLCMLWTVRLDLSVLISDPHSSFVCALTPSKLFVFSPASQQPDLIREHDSKSEIIAAKFVTWEKSTCVYFINADQELFCLENKGNENQKIEGVEKNWKTPFSAQLAKQSKADVEEKRELEEVKSRLESECTKTMMEAPPHTLPNPAILCSDLLKSLLLAAETHLPSKSTILEEDGIQVVQVEPDRDTDDRRVLLEEELSKIVDRLFV